MTYTKPMPSTTVYSYYMPEVEPIVQEVLNSGEIHRTLRGNYFPGLDDLHEPLMDKYERFMRSQGVIGVEQFEHRYFTNGSSEGIFHWLAQYATDSLMDEGDGPQLYQFAGEYQGYQEFAKTLGLHIQDIDVSTREDLRNTIPWAKKRPGIFIFSHPSAIDGNVRDKLLKRVLDDGHQVFLDLAYCGATQRPLNVDLRHPGIIGVCASMSKPFGLYYYRIGFLWTRREVKSLYGNKWFKNAMSIAIGEAVLDNLSFNTLITNGMARQKNAFISARGDLGFFRFPQEAANFKRSDVWLLAHSTHVDGEMATEALKDFKRGTSYRYCLTPYFRSFDNNPPKGRR